MQNKKCFGWWRTHYSKHRGVRESCSDHSKCAGVTHMQKHKPENTDNGPSIYSISLWQHYSLTKNTWIHSEAVAVATEQWV